MLLLVSLATWRISHALTKEKGPWGLLEHQRGKFGGFLTCIYCASFWVAILATAPYYFAGLIAFWQWPLWVFATSGAAMMLRAYSGVIHDNAFASSPDDLEDLF